MNNPKTTQIISCLLVLTFDLSTCNFSAAPSTSTPAQTDTPGPTATNTTMPTNTPLPSATPKPTRTPNLAETQRYEDYNAEAERYFDLGYLTTTDGKFRRQPTYKTSWAQIGWYRRSPIYFEVSDFFITAHIEWSSAYRSADISGCGFAFATQKNGDHYAVFLDRSQIYFVETEYYYRPFGTTRGTGSVSFDNPFDHPVEADFTLIVQDAYAYVLVNGDLVGEYTLSQSKNLRGGLAFAILSGTNRDFGTRCEMTNIHIFIPE